MRYSCFYLFDRFRRMFVLLVLLFSIFNSRYAYSIGYFSNPSKYYYNKDFLFDFNWRRPESGAKSSIETFKREWYVPYDFSFGFALPYGIFALYIDYYDQFDFLRSNFQDEQYYLKDGIRKRGYIVSAIHAWGDKKKSWGLKYSHSFGEYNKIRDQDTTSDHDYSPGATNRFNYQDYAEWITESVVLEYGMKGRLDKRYNAFGLKLQYITSKEYLDDYECILKDEELTLFTNKNYFHENVLHIKAPQDKYTATLYWEHDEKLTRLIFLNFGLSTYGSYAPINYKTEKTNYYINYSEVNSNTYNYYYYYDEYNYKDKGNCYTISYKPSCYLSLAILSIGFSFKDSYTFEKLDEELNWQYNTDAGVINFDLDRLINTKTYTYNCRVNFFLKNALTFVLVQYSIYERKISEKAYVDSTSGAVYNQEIVRDNIYESKSLDKYDDFYCQAGYLFYGSRFELSISIFFLVLKWKTSEQEDKYGADVSLSFGFPGWRDDEKKKEIDKPVSTKNEVKRVEEYFKIGDQAYSEKKYQKAMSYYYKIYQIQKDNQRAIYNLACVCALLNHKKEAILWLKNVLKLNPDLKERVKQDPDFQNLQEEDAFQQLVE